MYNVKGLSIDQEIKLFNFLNLKRKTDLDLSQFRSLQYCDVP